MRDLEEAANRNRSDISKIFNDIRSKIIERETTLKRRISDTLEKELMTIRRKIATLDDQMQCIQNLKEEAMMIESEHMFETLIQAPYRFEIENESCKRVETFTAKVVFPEIKKDEEITKIIRDIVPSHLKPSLLTQTLTYAKKKDKPSQDEHS